MHRLELGRLLPAETAFIMISTPPFDLRTESVLVYSDDLDDLQRRLEAAIAAVRGTLPRADPASDRMG